MQLANELLARTMKARGITTIFHIPGAPNIELTRSCEKHGIQLIGVRHEGAGAGMAFAHARVTGRPAVCLAPAGPGAINMIPSAVHAMAEETPVILLGGSSPLRMRGTGGFQEVDQMALFAPSVKKTLALTRGEDIGRLFDEALATATSPKQGAVYVDLPGDLLIEQVPAPDEIPPSDFALPKPEAPSPQVIDAILDALEAAQRPVIISGSGVIWSHAGAAMEEFVDLAGIPFFTTPQSRGVISEDHALAILGARSQAFREADFALSIGTRSNFIIGHLTPPRWAADLTVAMVNLDATELAKTKPAIPVQNDARVTLEALSARLRERGTNKARLEPWLARLRDKDASGKARMAEMEVNDSHPIHPLRLMSEISKILEKDGILVEDGHETLGFCRHSLKSYVGGHRINPGFLGNVGLGVPFAVGAKAAKPDKQVVVVSGDSAFGWNGIEIDTACRHNLPIICIICNNAGISARPTDPTKPMMPGQDLGTPDYQMLATAFGGYGERVEKVEDIAPALRRAIDSGRPAILNVIVDPYVHSATDMGFAGVMSQVYAEGRKR